MTISNYVFCILVKLFVRLLSGISLQNYYWPANAWNKRSVAASVKRKCIQHNRHSWSWQCVMMTQLHTLNSRHDVITRKMFQEIKDPKHPLHYLLPPIKVSNNSQMVLWPTYPYPLLLSKTSRYGWDLWTRFRPI